jgi:transposase InsO family protein
MRKNNWTVRQTARYFGFNPATISKWNQKAPPGGVYTIPTESSKPKSHPKKLDPKIVSRIVELRKLTNGRCSEVIHQLLLNEGTVVSLNSVKRTLARNYLIKKRSPWKRLHKSTIRPPAVNTGDLVQLDTIHLMKNEKERIYVYTLIDVYSRWAYALATNKMNSRKTVQFVKSAKQKLPFSFNCLQSDHGPEFSQHFTERIRTNHRHSRVRRPNDNAHLERFNRTLQTEFLRKLPVDVNIINRYLPRYLKYYNEERLHLGLNLKTPAQFINQCCQAIG